MDNYILKNTPLAGINYSFEKYVREKRSIFAKRMDGNGIPNYAYKMDHEHRKRLDSMPGLFKLAKTLSATLVPQQLQMYNMQGVAVGPNQYPEIYKMVRECAETLGIGIPNVLIVSTIYGMDLNAVTYASDDVEPIIIITGLMLERFTAEEIKAVIGHECGHIQNMHTVYSILEDYITNIGYNGLLRIPGIDILLGALTTSAQLALNMWSRAAEVTADRAALICSGDVNVARNVDVKFMFNAADLSQSTQTEINLDALKEQLDTALNSPYRLSELNATHPLSLKRIFATMDFNDCATFYEWRPDLKVPGKKLYTKDQIDEKCKKYIDVVNPKDAKKNKGAKR